MTGIFSNQRLLERFRQTFRTRFAQLGLTAGLLLILTGLALGFSRPIKDAAPDPSTELMDLALPAIEQASKPVHTDISGSMETVSLAEPGPDWQDVVVKPGQSLDAIFRQQGYSANLLHQILGLSKTTRKLSSIKPGQVFQFANDETNRFRSMRVALDETLRLTVRDDGEALIAEEELREIDARIEHASGVINDSLFLAGQRAGMSDNLIMKLANIFGWDIDFVLDIRQGDQFHLIYEKLYREGEYLRDGDILAATFINQDNRFRAVRRLQDDKSEYFAPDGRNMRKAFLRAPLNFAYISSRFNPRRFHPILKRVKAHNGIDYRAPKGTPVYAAGDGKVIRSAYSQYNGHHVFIQHGNNIVTKYLHFTKRSVKNGQRVKQGKTIGYVGATGLAQAPHLHYEFVVDGVHRNPRTVNLPKAEPLPEAELVEFLSAATPFLDQLRLMEDRLLLASQD